MGHDEHEKTASGRIHGVVRDARGLQSSWFVPDGPRAKRNLRTTTCNKYTHIVPRN